MPITPFHFGPGVLLKAAAPQHVSLSSFIVANVAIDLESAYFLYTGGWPVHRTLHTFAFATCVGLVAGYLVHVLRRPFQLAVPGKGLSGGPHSALIGGGLGGFTHALFDGIMHSDMHPFRPVSEGNPLLLAVGLGTLHLFCVAAGVGGGAWLAWRWRQDRPV